MHQAEKNCGSLSRWAGTSITSMPLDRVCSPKAFDQCPCGGFCPSALQARQTQSSHLHTAFPAVALQGHPGDVVGLTDHLQSMDF